METTNEDIETGKLNNVESNVKNTETVSNEANNVETEKNEKNNEQEEENDTSNKTEENIEVEKEEEESEKEWVPKVGERVVLYKEEIFRGVGVLQENNLIIGEKEGNNVEFVDGQWIINEYIPTFKPKRLKMLKRRQRT